MYRTKEESFIKIVASFSHEKRSKTRQQVSPTDVHKNKAYFGHL